MTWCIRTIRLLRDISRSLLSFAGVFSLDWRCGGLSVVPSGLSLLSFGTQHFVLGYFRSSLWDLLFFLVFLSFVGVFSWTALWGLSVVPSGLSLLFVWYPALRAGLVSVVPSGLLLCLTMIPVPLRVIDLLC